MEPAVRALEISMAEIKTTLEYIKTSLVKNDSQHKEIIARIDHLNDTFQTRVGDKASEAEVRERFDEIDHLYVTKDAFGPIQKLVYGLVGAICLAFMGAVFALVFVN